MRLLNPIPKFTDFPKYQYPYRISQYFGENPAIYAQFGHKGHNGIDIACPEWTPVVAMHDGWIAEAVDKDTGYGIRITQYFEADGFGYDLTYGHFKQIIYPKIPWNIQRKDYPVTRGTVIGYVDSTGFSTGHHLHITLRQYQNYQLLNANNGYGGAIDPFPYIAKDHMITFIKQENSNEFGFMEQTPLGFHIVRAVDEDHLRKMAMGSSVPLPTNPDGSIDYSKAKVIRL